MAAIREGQERGFLALQELLDHDARAGLPEAAVAHDGGNRIARLAAGGAHQHAFARGQSVRLDHDRRVDTVQIAVGFVRIVEHPELRGRHAVFVQQRFGERLAGFESGRGASGAEHPQPTRLEQIDDAQAERELGADDGQGDPFGFGERGQPVQIVGRQIDRLGMLRDAGVARRAIHLRDVRALPELPDQGVLASAATDDQDLHRAFGASVGNAACR